MNETKIIDLINDSVYLKDEDETEKIKENIYECWKFGDSEMAESDLNKLNSLSIHDCEYYAILEDYS